MPPLSGWSWRRCRPPRLPPGPGSRGHRPPARGERRPPATATPGRRPPAAPRWGRRTTSRDPTRRRRRRPRRTGRWPRPGDQRCLGRRRAGAPASDRLAQQPGGQPTGLLPSPWGQLWIGPALVELDALGQGVADQQQVHRPRLRAGRTGPVTPGWTPRSRGRAASACAPAPTRSRRGCRRCAMRRWRGR